MYVTGIVFIIGIINPVSRNARSSSGRREWWHAQNTDREVVVQVCYVLHTCTTGVYSMAATFLVGEEANPRILCSQTIM